MQAMISKYIWLTPDRGSVLNSLLRHYRFAIKVLETFEYTYMQFCNLNDQSESFLGENQKFISVGQLFANAACH